MIPMELWLSDEMKKRRENATAKVLKEKPKIEQADNIPQGFYWVNDKYWVQVYEDNDSQIFLHCECAAGSPPIDEATGLPSREPSICYHGQAVLLHIAEQEKENA